MSIKDRNISLNEPFRGAQDPGDNGYGVSKALIQKAWSLVGCAPYTPPPSAERLPARPLVVIDPGHGSYNEESSIGYDAGKSPDNSDYHEIEVIDPVSRALADELREKGFDVAFTRLPGEKLDFDYNEEIGDQKLSPRQARADFAHKLADLTGHADVYFIGIHANENRSSKIKGAFIYAASETNKNGKVDFGRPPADMRAQKLTQTIAQNYTLEGSNPSRAQTADITAIEAFEARGEGVNSARSAALIELGFMSNPQDSAALKDLITDPCKAATDIAEGIFKFHQEEGLKPIPVDVVSSPSINPVDPIIPSGKF